MDFVAYVQRGLQCLSQQQFFRGIGNCFREMERNTGDEMRIRHFSAKRYLVSFAIIRGSLPFLRRQVILVLKGALQAFLHETGKEFIHIRVVAIGLCNVKKGSQPFFSQIQAEGNVRSLPSHDRTIADVSVGKTHGEQ